MYISAPQIFKFCPTQNSLPNPKIPTATPEVTTSAGVVSTKNNGSYGFFTLVPWVFQAELSFPNIPCSMRIPVLNLSHPGGRENRKMGKGKCVSSDRHVHRKEIFQMKPENRGRNFGGAVSLCGIRAASPFRYRAFFSCSLHGQSPTHTQPHGKKA